MFLLQSFQEETVELVFLKYLNWPVEPSGSGIFFAGKFLTMNSVSLINKAPSRYHEMSGAAGGRLEGVTLPMVRNHYFVSVCLLRSGPFHLSC